MKISKLSALQMVALLSAAGLTTAFADEPPNDVRLGLYSVFYHASADDLSGPYVPAGVNFKAENLETLYVGIIRHLPANFAIELALGYPPLSKLKGSGPATVGSVPYNGQVIGERALDLTHLALRVQLPARHGDAAPLHRSRHQLHDVLRPQQHGDRQRGERRSDPELLERIRGARRHGRADVPD